MEIIKGAFSEAHVFTTNNTDTALDQYARAQLQMICDNESSKGCLIRVMPDVHPGKVGTIGLTMTIEDRIMPNLIGIDIGCGMTLGKIKGKKIEGQKLDTVIRDCVPSGFNIKRKPHRFAEDFDFSDLYCSSHIRTDKARLSLGTLGGGNHFIEVDKDTDNDLYIVIHTGSRHLGKEVTEYYLNEGQKALKSKGIDVPYELTWLDGELKDSYLHDMQIVQNFASLNRQIILDELVKGMKWKVLESYECIHNYVDASSETLALFNSPIMRKGAISAKNNEKVIIPVNMRDGIILGTGLGNKDWNCSAPHGSGRIMKREDVKNSFTVSSFKSEMKGIYSSCIGKDTLDEAPFAYRPVTDITDVINATVKIDKIIKPVYNYKAGGE
ncbi:RNA-splicing ligase RtcB, repairs tRNA damage [Oribacterium sp. KHPX15]|uniref:RtcB family protein n=1 Tax=Oribacterium sp. KHPX15 TaxID=1855342 RepID=UPI00089AD73C|nr:RtcB family protein [Oribacterium sp. KHPX15]SEA70702.1 RNA-splicing ligase RtcB, repairs tRNA damage [Oribacterium sp. KHPX15]